MTHVCTLIATPDSHALDDRLIDHASACLPDARAPKWLAPNEACDIPFAPGTGADNTRLEKTVRDVLGLETLDVAIQPGADRRRRLLVADMDSTIIQQECIDEIADFAGMKPKIAEITERAMRGELEFETALRERVGLLAGLDEGVLQKVFDERIALMPGARTLVRTMRTNGSFCVLVSGGFTFFTSQVAAAVGFDSSQANSLKVADGKLSGSVDEPILGQHAKLEALRRYRDELGIAAGETLAVGDGANDLAMIREAGLGVAFHAKPVVAASAQVRIDHGDLTALLYLQGYTRREFIGHEPG